MLEIFSSPQIIIAIVSGLGLILVGIGFFLIPTDTQSRLN